MITVQYDKASEFMELHLDSGGVDKLIKILENLKQAAPGDEHLFTNEWGGSGLDSSPMNLSIPVVNHLKIMVWSKDHTSVPERSDSTDFSPSRRNSK